MLLRSENPAPETIGRFLQYLRSLWTKRAIPSKENFLIASCEGVRLSAEAFLSLRDRVSDELLDAYMYCCLRAKKYEISSPLLMGFYNIGRRHWVLIMISCIEKRLTVLDPLGESKMTMQCILSTWKNFLRISKKNTSLSCGNWYVNTIPHTKQQDSSSCGIFCLMFVEKLLEEEALFFNTCSDAITAFRVKVASRIIENQDDETLHSLCRICQKTDSMKGKLRYIDWVGCDDCGLFWCHFSCMKMSSSYHDFIQQK
ncbi:uncharacterized protein LOC125672780 isoform X2 [Ostrea edulis]|uniref:uncharacterized protein LOC125672780 isoform X2 n=1 Tax=Ostrea edulis TaxID=37623 RepID=UPI0024AF0720|nr:uncharacterized protein LOC125672780 isoform X2 [Ostrea edulis]